LRGRRRERRQRNEEKKGEVVMTQEFQHIPEQSSRLDRFVMGSLMSAVIVLAGLLTFAPYSLI